VTGWLRLVRCERRLAANTKVPLARGSARRPRLNVVIGYATRIAEDEPRPLGPATGQNVMQLDDAWRIDGQ
jgi:hypothetical protein